MVNPAILAEISMEGIQSETVNTTIPLSVPNSSVISPTNPKTFAELFPDDLIRFLTVMNSLYILGCIMDWW